MFKRCADQHPPAPAGTRSARHQAKQRDRERVRVEKAYARANPTPIVPVTPETREELKLTRKGRYELGSNGKLTALGKQTRLKHRYNVIIVLSLIGLVAVYSYFLIGPR